MGRKISGINVLETPKGYQVNYKLEVVKMDRIRRITGYLTGNLDRWNNAKAKEEMDRVKHSVTSGFESI